MLFDPNIDPATARSGKWTVDEDTKLKDAVPTQGAKNWDAIAALVRGRTKIQCCNRWHDVLISVLVSTIDPTTTRTGNWTANEDKELKDAVPAQVAKNWDAIAALVPGRTKKTVLQQMAKVVPSSNGRGQKLKGEQMGKEV
jgi:myb proto-oncogene protein